jgi:riboflavin biosynthesis pyrimidine reductase
MTPRFEEYCRRKTEAAVSVSIPGFRTAREDAAAGARLPIGNAWSRALFDGFFYRAVYDGRRVTPAMSLVFVQSRDGNTGADDPSILGGGATDKHLVYEGLSRVDADGVLAGATTARDDHLVFSVWHPELVRLRLDRGQPRHPAQIVLTDRGDLPIHRALMYNEPSLRVIIVTSTPGTAVLRLRLPGRDWIEVVDAGQPIDLIRGMRELAARGMRVVSAVGGRRAASALLRDGLVDDLYLTTSPRPGGEPDTPLYGGPALDTELLLEKRGLGEDEGVLFQHHAIRR